MKLPSPALIVATAALFVALGGTSYAVMKLPRNSVGSAQIKNGSILATDLSKAVAIGAKGETGAKGADAPIPTACTWVLSSGTVGQPTGANRHTICKNQDLVGLDISTVAQFGDFTGSHLTGTSLIGAHMYSVNLTSATLTGADMTRAHLDDATLVSTNMDSSELTGATLTGANLSDAILTGANLTGANLAYAILNRANLTGATGTPLRWDVAIWNDTTCPNGTNSDTHGNTCVGYGL